MASAAVKRALVLSLVLAPLMLGAGCTQPCLALAQKICDCQTTEIGKQNCLQRMQSLYAATNQNKLNAQAAACSQLIDTCDCHKLDTEAGKRACGLAR